MTAPARLVWLTGCNTAATRALAHRDDIGLLGTPAGGTIAARLRYAGGWAIDNGAFKEFAPDARPDWRRVRYELATGHPVLELLERLDPAEAPRFVTLPDVVEDYRATWERSSYHYDTICRAGWPVAICAQDGLDTDAFALGSILNALSWSAEHTGAGVLFIGGSTEWKLGPGARHCVDRALARGLTVHMGRVNTARRIRYAASIGCTSCDGTAARNGPDAVDVIRRALDLVNDPPPQLDLGATA